MSTRVIGWALMGLISGCCCVAACTPSDVAEPARTQQRARSDQDAPDRTRPETGQEPSQLERSAQKIEVVEEAWPGGNIRLRREIVRDEKGEPVSHGATTQWWESGEKKSKLWFRNGVRHGSRVQWFRSGQVWSQGAYKNGNAVGTWTVWDRQGKREREWSYDDDGAFHGMFTLWHTNGSERMEVEFDRGRKQGFETQWYENGNILLEIDYGRDLVE